LPAHIPWNDKRGTENLNTSDIRLPGLRMAQSNTPQAKRADPAYIQGLLEGGLFNTTTREVYPEAGVRVVFIEALGHQNIQFAPIGEGGGIIESNIPDNDPRCDFGKDAEGKKCKPIATRFYNYLLVLVHPDGRREILTWSIKGANLKAGGDLNFQLFSGKIPVFGKYWKLTPKPMNKKGFSYFVIDITPDGYTNDSDFKFAEKAFTDLHGKSVALDVEPETAETKDDIPF
jgi:hypothetical protein